MTLPEFKYHPDPIASGSVIESENKCKVCKKARGYIYQGPAYCEDDLEEAICPWCIADGSAHEKFDVSFTDVEAFPDDLAPEVVEEIAFRTPGFAAWQESKWLGCCKDAAAFVEPAGRAEINAKYPLLEGTLMTFIVQELHVSGGAAVRMLNSLDRDQSPTAFVFKCLHCDNNPVYVDGIFDIE